MTLFLKIGGVGGRGFTTYEVRYVKGVNFIHLRYVNEVIFIHFVNIL